MAWSILKMQSDEILTKADVRQESQEDDSWSPADLNIYESPEDLDYTTLVMKGIDPPLQEMLRRQGTRPVTLMELVDAFDEAKKEAELRQKMMEFRKQRYKLDVDFNSKVHKEDLGEDISLTWKRILQYNGSSIPLSNLCDCSHKGNEDMITVFVSILFLAHMKMIKLNQRQVPSGEIFIQNISRRDENITEMIAQAVALGADNNTGSELPPQEKFAAAA
jgi:segregation and condensation protein A